MPHFGSLSAAGKHWSENTPITTGNFLLGCYLLLVLSTMTIASAHVVQRMRGVWLTNVT